MPSPQSTIESPRRAVSKRQSLEDFYAPNLRISHAHQLLGYNAGYAVETPGLGTFDQHQKDLVWRLIGDTPITEDSTVIDVGCGIGGPSEWIFERYRPARLIGIEFCNTSVRTADRRWHGRMPRPFFLNGDAQRIPLADESADVVFNLESALHYPDKEAFIHECRRVLRPGGYLCLGDICTQYRRTFAALGMLNHLRTQFSTHDVLWSIENYLECFRAVGFRLLRQEEVSRQAAYSLRDGLAEIIKNGWAAARGYRRRYLYLCFIEKLLRRRWLAYPLFALIRA